MKNNKKGIYDSIRKPLAPATKVFKNKREELLIGEAEKEIMENTNRFGWCKTDEITRELEEKRKLIQELKEEFYEQHDMEYVRDIDQVIESVISFMVWKR